MNSSMEGTWLSEPLRDLRRIARSPERGRMSKPRTIWVPRLRRMQRPAVSEDVASLLAALEQGLHEVGPQLQSIFSMLEWQTGQRRSTLLIIMVTLLCVYMVIGQNAPFVCNLFIYVIAAYSSFHNIENSTKNDDSRWIVFWVIFGLFSMIDHITDQIQEHFPLFWLFKLLFLTWCLAPTRSNGATTIYFHLLYPLFLGVNDRCTMVTNFGDGQELCNRIWQRCYPWAPATSDEGQLRGAGKSTGPPSEEPAADKKPAGDSKAKTSINASAAPLDQAGTEKSENEKMVHKKNHAAASNSEGTGKATVDATAEKGKKQGATGSLSKAHSSSPDKDKQKQGATTPSSKAQSSSSIASKKAATAVSVPSPSISKDVLEPLGTTQLAVPRLNGQPSQAPSKSASDSVIKSKTGMQDMNEETYESHLSSNRGSKGLKSEKGPGMSSWNDVSMFSKRDDLERRLLQDEERGGSLSSFSANKSSSIPVIQPVVQPLFSLHSSPYSSTYGSARNAPFPGQPVASPYAFGPSYPSYHAGPFYPGCMPRHPLGYNRARMLLYNGPMQKQKSPGTKKLPSPDESEGDSFIDDVKPAGKVKAGDSDHACVKPGQHKDAKSSSTKEEVKKATGEDKAEDKKKPAG